MKIWMEVLNPKQLWYYSHLAKEFRRKGAKVWLTARKYEQLTSLIKEIPDGIELIGRWGGGTLVGKLGASVERSRLLLQRVMDERPDVVLSSGSIEAVRIAYGLSFPHFLCSDSPHSPVNLLCAPPSSSIFTPWLISKSYWESVCASKKIIHYKALDPLVWLSDLPIDEHVLSKYSLKKREYVVVRAPEIKASYLIGAKHQETAKIVSLIQKHLPDHEVVVFERYRGERREISDGFKLRFIRPTLDAPQVLRHSCLFIGGGGTMTQEAAIMGVPSVSTYPRTMPTVLEYLVSIGLTKRVLDNNSLAKYLKYFSEHKENIIEQQRRRSAKLSSKMKDPKPMITSVVLSATR